MKELATQHSYKVSTLLSVAGHPADLHSSHVHMEKKSDGGKLNQKNVQYVLKREKTQNRTICIFLQSFSTACKNTAICRDDPVNSQENHIRDMEQFKYTSK